MHRKRNQAKMRRLAVDRLNPRARAILLLTADLHGGSHRPLDIVEWAELAGALTAAGNGVEDLLARPVDEVVPDSILGGISPSRLAALLQREGELEDKLIAWRAAGVTTLTQADGTYPRRFLATFGQYAPPVVHCVGNPTLLRRPAIAVVGSRRPLTADQELTARISARAAREKLSVVTGSTKGSNAVAMQAALVHGGKVVVVEGDDLTKAAAAQRYQASLREQRLVLVSPSATTPEAATWAAPDRDRYIYCLADCAVVTSCGYGEGGTWEGAAENLRQAWTPTWAGNGAKPLLRRGARSLPELADRRLTQALMPSRPDDQPTLTGFLPGPAPRPLHLPTLRTARSNFASSP